MSLSQRISINTHYTRSINLERDADSKLAIQSYIPTSRALRTLARVAETFSLQNSPRSWSLVGPYGSGKSAFSLFLSHLLNNPEDERGKIAHGVLARADKNLAGQYAHHFKSNSEGYFRVLITGAPEPLTQRIVKALSAAAEDYWSRRKGKKPGILGKLRNLSQQREVTISAVMECLSELQSQLAKTSCSGILLVIDELGKFLEYEARHYGANEIYLLQKLAEHAQQSNAVNLLLFVLLHQSFEQYAKGLGESLKSEWAKIQGRFEEIPFLESTEQVLKIVARALHQDLTSKERENVSKQVAAITEILAGQDALPGAMDQDDAASLLSACFPLHPVSAILLPTLCQKIAQNERSLFSYLGSHEEHGFQDMLTRLDNADDFIYPHHLYDYFIANQSVTGGDYLTHRRWVEVVTAIDRMGDARESEINLLKTIGILNIAGSRGGFKASKAILESCQLKGSGLTSTVKTLLGKSVVNFRRFNNEYRVWQGSDFDLEEALRGELDNLGEFSLAEELNRAKSLLPVVARRYTIQNGALRFFVPVFVDAQSYLNAPKQADIARIIFYLSCGQDDERLFHKEVVGYFSELDLVTLCYSGTQLQEAVAETQALKRVAINRQELNGDPIAKREFDDRLNGAAQIEDRLLQNLLDFPELSQWHHGKGQLAVVNKRSLQEVLSGVLQSIYKEAPIIRNELINRDEPSSQANAARNKVLYAMLNHPESLDLNIDKFPPEKAIYRSLLRETGLHRPVDDFGDVWGFSEPETDGRKDRCNMRHVWARINAFLDATELEAKSFAELNRVLQAPPYGLKAGVLPILYFTVYMVYRHELAFFEEKRYLPQLGNEELERFVKRPDQFTVQRFRITGLKASIYDQYQKALFRKKEKRTVVELIQPLAAFIGALPRFTLKTKSQLYVSPSAIAVRDAFEFASSPEKLLFTDLPRALGFDPEQTENLESFPEALQKTIAELKHAYPVMLQQQQALLCKAFEIRNGELGEIRRKFAWYAELENFTIDKDGLRAFLNRLSDPQGSDAQWLESVLSFLGRLPTEQWTDVTCSEVDFKLAADYSQRVLDLHKLYIAYGSNKRADRQDIDVYLLKSVRLGGDSLEEVVVVDNEHRQVIESIKERLRQALEDTTGGSLRKAALAAFVDEFLTETAQAKQTNKKTNKNSRKLGS